MGLVMLSDFLNKGIHLKASPISIEYRIIEKKNESFRYQSAMVMNLLSSILVLHEVWQNKNFDAHMVMSGFQKT